MSASPSHPTNPAKRPLEDASSPSRGNDQPEAKRPALDKVINNGDNDKDIELPESNGDGVSVPTGTNGTAKPEDTNQDKAEIKDDQGDTVVPDVEEAKSAVDAAVSGPTGVSGAAATNTHDETTWIHIRAVISSPEAATIIGKGGENVSNIRKLSSAKCTVSDYQKGAVERILTVSGAVEAVAKVFNQPLILYHF